MLDRILRVIRLDWTVFREIALDPRAMTEAAIIVAAAAFLSAIGGGAAADSFFGGFFGTFFAEILFGWIGWAVLTYLVGTMMFKGKTNIPEMLRVLGYASAPILLGVFGIIPCFRWIAAVAGWTLSLIAGVFAIREAMGFDTENAVITALISWITGFVIRIILYAVF